MSLNLLSLTNIVGSTVVVEVDSVDTETTLLASGSHKRVNSIVFSSNNSTVQANATARIKINNDTYCIARLTSNSFIECIPNGPFYLSNQQSMTVTISGTVDSNDPPTCTVSYEEIS
jgi:hypothetical protein